MCKNYTLDCEEEKMGCKGCAYNKKSADEMFEDIGYEIIENTNTTLNYELIGKYMDKEIIFEKLDKSFSAGYSTGECCHITMQELKAINKKVEELGWE